MGRPRALPGSGRRARARPDPGCAPASAGPNSRYGRPAREPWTWKLPDLRLLDPRLRGLYELRLHDQTVLVVGEGAGLEAHDVLALDGLLDVDVVGPDDAAVEYPVDVPGTLRVLQQDPLTPLQLVQVPEDEKALRAWVAE